MVDDNGAHEFSWEYVDRSPSKGATVKGKHASRRYGITTFNLGT
jgi:hypothetical protein